MKVLQINSVCGYGSTGRICTDLYKILRRQGHDCTIAYGRGEALESIETIKIGTRKDNYFHVAYTRVFDRHGFSSKKSTIKFIEQIKEINPDIIHLHNLHGYYLNMPELVRGLNDLNKPIIWTLYDCWSFTGHCSHFDYVQCHKWVTGCFECPEKGNYPKSIFLDSSRKNYQDKRELFNSIQNLTLVVPSKWLESKVKLSFLREKNIRVLPNGIDLNVFYPRENKFKQEKSIESKTIILGVASIWTERKGLSFFAKLAKDLPANYQIVLVGVTEKQKKALPENIMSISRTDSVDTLAEIYTAADVFINPTLEETQGLTNIEALACGTPVITFNTGGAPESVDEFTGIVIERANYKELYEAITGFDARAYLKENCLEKANLYDVSKLYQRYINLYDEKFNKEGLAHE